MTAIRGPQPRFPAAEAREHYTTRIRELALTRGSNHLDPLNQRLSTAIDLLRKARQAEWADPTPAEEAQS